MTVAGDPDFPVNAGALCVKGYTAGETLAHPDRLRAPLVRNASGQLIAAGWDEAIDTVAAGIRAIRTHGRDADRRLRRRLADQREGLPARQVRPRRLRTPHIDYNGRFCMSSAAAAGLRAFGLDRGLPFPVSDIADADVDPARRRQRRGDDAADHAVLRRAASRRRPLIVVDPRLTDAAQARRCLRLVPGTDAALANGLLHVLIHDG